MKVIRSAAFRNPDDFSLSKRFAGTTLSRFDEGHGYARKPAAKDAGQVVSQAR